MAKFITALCLNVFPLLTIELRISAVKSILDDEFT